MGNNETTRNNTGVENNTENNTETGNNTSGGVDIKALLKLVETSGNGETRVENTVKLYKDKLNVAVNSGVETGVKYSVKVGGETLIIYEDKKGNTTGGEKGKTGVMLSLNKAVKNNACYIKAVKQGKIGKTCKDYDITTETSDGVEYMLVDLAQYSPKPVENTETGNTGGENENQ